MFCQWGRWVWLVYKTHKRTSNGDRSRFHPEYTSLDAKRQALHFDRGDSLEWKGTILGDADGERRDILVARNMYLQGKRLVGVAEIRKNAPRLSREAEKPAVQYLYED